MTGERGISTLLDTLAQRFGWDPVTENGNIIALRRKDCRKGGAVSLEPGGQLELSGAPLETVHETYEELRQHLVEVGEVGGELGIGFLGIGFSPKWTLEQTPVMPKQRYRIMRRYMPTRGRHGLDMMFRTATVQVNMDFADEADMVAKLRVGLALQPVATALFANSPFTRRKAERLSVLPRRDVARHRPRSHRAVALRLRCGHGLRALCRLRA